jgi:hypothetical protein
MADAETKKGYLRLNHFHGLRLESNDFQVGEEYHCNKRKLHNKVFHGYGVVQGYMEGLRVLGRKRGDMSIEVTPGYAIDGEGNDIFLHETEVKTIDAGKFKLPTTVYVVCKYVDEPTDFVVNAANPKYKGHKRVLETSKVEIVANEPTPDEGIELARVLITASTAEVKEPHDPSNPGEGEIDTRFVPRAGVCGSTLDPDIAEQFRAQLGFMRKYFTDLGINWRLHTARDIRDVVIAAQMLATLNLIPTQKDATMLFKLIVDLEDELLREYTDTYPDSTETKEFLNFKESVHGLLHLLKAPKFTKDEFSSVLSYQFKASDMAQKIAISEAPKEPEPVAPAPQVVHVQAAAPVPGAPPPPPPPAPEPEKPKKKPGAKELTWEELQKLSGELPDSIFMDGKNFKLSDKIDMVDKKSEQEHKFIVEGAKDTWSTNQTYTYPDKTAMSSKGRAHVGGFSQWVFKNLKAGMDLVIAKRIDYAYSGLVTAIYADGQKVGDWKIEGQDRKDRWRNWLFKIPGSFVKGDSVVIKQESVEADREVNMFKLWCYQAED